jgi:plasmid stabilization system protein ParE
MNVVFSRLALGQLDEILSHITQRSPQGAKRVEARFRRVVELIAEHPEAAQEMIGRPGVRRAPLIRYPYLIYYTIDADEVTILRIRHAARRPWEE